METTSEVREFLIEFIAEELEMPTGDVNDFSELVGEIGRAHV